MILNTNETRLPEGGAITRYTGVASVNVVAVNPDNAELRQAGWNIPDDAEEPSYVTETPGSDGKMRRSARVRLLARITDLRDGPVIGPVVPLDFWCRPEPEYNREMTKCRVIDSFCRTAWATKAEMLSQSVPVYANGMKADISPDYRQCMRGEAELTAFLFRYLNLTPFRSPDRKTGEWRENQNPGRLSIDGWEALCEGDASEIREYLAMRPYNLVKVVLGVRENPDGLLYQTFLSTAFIGNGARPDPFTGEYAVARRETDRFMARFPHSTCSFTAGRVREYGTEESVTAVPGEDTALVQVCDDLPFAS